MREKNNPKKVGIFHGREFYTARFPRTLMISRCIWIMAFFIGMNPAQKN